MKQCTHKRKGIVNNQPESLALGAMFDRDRPYAARSVCDREDCIRAAKRWVAAETNETAYYTSDAERFALK